MCCGRGRVRGGFHGGNLRVGRGFIRGGAWGVGTEELKGMGEIQ